MFISRNDYQYILKKLAPQHLDEQVMNTNVCFIKYSNQLICYLVQILMNLSFLQQVEETKLISHLSFISNNTYSNDPRCPIVGHVAFGLPRLSLCTICVTLARIFIAVLVPILHFWVFARTKKNKTFAHLCRNLKYAMKSLETWLYWAYLQISPKLNDDQTDLKWNFSLDFTK